MCPLVCRHTGLVVFKTAPWSGGFSPSARNGPSAPGERQTKEQGSPVCSTWDQRHLSGERRCRTAGCERGRMPTQVATRLRRAQDSSAANTVKAQCEKAGISLSACAGSKVRSGSRDCEAVKLLSTQIVRKQAKAISSRTTLHIACSVVVNAFQQYEWLAGWQQRSKSEDGQY